MKHTWLWDATLMNTRGAEILDFCHKNQVDVIFVQWSTRVLASDYWAFISDATALGIEVHACLGEKTWYDPAGYSTISGKLADIIGFQEAAAVTERFTGIHFDIEPHTLPEWQADQAGTAAKWMQTVDMYTADVRKMGLQLSASVPFSIANVSDPLDGTVAAHMMRQHDKVVVMSYRDFALGPDSITEHAKPFLEQAEIAQMPNVVVIAVETKDTSEGGKLTFAQEGKLVMYQQLRLVKFFAKQYRSYAGTAIHAVNYWMDLQL